jgi:hypothetical protein
MPKPHVTRTYATIHFEDLDPKRFEDLVRELVYDFKAWQNLEATGRSGSDDGFDIRGFERTTDIAVSMDEDGVEEEAGKSKDGNLWMIQVKREKDIGPTRIKEILKDVDSANPPYGYILAASADFSKKSHDAFRAELQAKGVMEFHLWGRANLEDMLHQPKNDRILFTFFGISMASRRRSRTSELRAKVGFKNKVIRVFGEDGGHTEFLVRDANDERYPFKDEYPDFSSNPKWKVYEGFFSGINGIRIELGRHFGYVDHQKKEYDFFPGVPLRYDRSETQEVNAKRYELRQLVEDYWTHLPKANQIHYIREGMIYFDDMILIDEKGDPLHDFPHIYVEYGKMGPFRVFRDHLEKGRDSFLLDGYKRVSIFPKTFSKPKHGKLHADNIALEEHFQHRILQHDPEFYTLYDVSGRYKHLKVRDAYPVANPRDRSSKNFIAITRKESMKVGVYLKLHPHLKGRIQEQIGRDPKHNELLTFYEFKRANEHEYKAK